VIVDGRSPADIAESRRSPSKRIGVQPSNPRGETSANRIQSRHQRVRWETLSPD
jgi:hypothetical protein